MTSSLAASSTDANTPQQSVNLLTFTLHLELSCTEDSILFPILIMVRYPGRDFTDNDIKLLETGNFADGTVSCKGRTWKVHRSLLASRLNFFKAAFYGSFAVRNSWDRGNLTPR